MSSTEGAVSVMASSGQPADQDPDVRVSPKSASGPVVELRGLGKRYGDLWAAHEISLQVAAGEVYGLLGPNGAGKTTTLRMIAGLLQPDAGEVRLHGKAPGADALEAKRHLGFLTGNTGLYQRLTPIELLTFFGELHELPAARIKARIDTLVEELDLSSFCDRPCGTLSTGQKQRINIARTLLHEPSLLILDEPTAGLDIISADFILKIIADCRDAGRAVLLSTHILAETELLCDRVGIINKGRLVREGTIEELLASVGEQRLSAAFLQIIHETNAALATAALPAQMTRDREVER